MKRTFICMFLLIILLTAAACGDTIKPTDNTEKDSNVGQLPNGYGEMATLPIESYEDYLKFVRSADLPNNFVRYETFSQFGEFKSLVCAPSSGYNEYNYCIIDKDKGIELTMYIDHGKELMGAEDVQILSEVNERDMRRISKKDGVYVFTQSGIEYTYINGDLMTVAWVSNGVRYMIFGELQNCKLGTSSALSKLLKLDTAAEAVASVKEPSEAIK